MRLSVWREIEGDHGTGEMEGIFSWALGISESSSVPFPFKDRKFFWGYQPQQPKGQGDGEQ